MQLTEMLIKNLNLLFFGEKTIVKKMWIRLGTKLTVGRPSLACFWKSWYSVLSKSRAYLHAVGDYLFSRVISSHLCSDCFEATRLKLPNRGGMELTTLSIFRKM